MQNIQRSKAFDLAFQFITETNLNLFLTGKAGTGKTTFLKYLLEKSHKNIVVAAPTGVAAINAKGVTLHSLFQLPFAPFFPGSTPQENTLNGHPLLSQLKFNKAKRDILNNMDLLVIDEVSMVAANTLDAIDIILKSIRRNYNLPFGGVQVLFIGDLHQLPPVVKQQDWSLLRSFYDSYFFFDSLVLKAFPPVMVELTEVYRQKDNSFVEILNGVRNNKLTETHLSILNSRLKPNFQPKEKGFITLTTHNSQSDSINQDQLDNLNASSFIYSATIKNDFPEHMFPANEDLELKVGAQVMFLRNDNEEKQYFNGKIAEVIELDKDSIVVKSAEEGNVIKVKKEVWKNINYKIDPVTREIEEEELGSFTQFPLRLAWAITIHKSQGLSFDKLIVDAERAFANGQVYVALSRARSLEGLVLTSPVSKQFLGATSSLKNWEAVHNNEDLLPERLEASRIVFLEQELLLAFDWSKWVELTMEINSAVKELEDKLSKDAQEWIADLSEKVIEFNKVAKSFQGNIKRIIRDPEFPNDQKALAERLKDASDYFSFKVEQWFEAFKTHPLEVKTKKAAVLLDEPAKELGEYLHDLIHRLNYFGEGSFELTAYLESGKVNKTRAPRIKSAYVDKKSQKSLVAASEIKHLPLYQVIADYRKEKSNKSSLPIYRIFSNNAIQGVCNNLPKTEEELALISGFGPVKIKQYGKDILQMVIDYCDDHQIPPKDLFSV